MSTADIIFHDGAKSVLETWGNAGPVVVCIHGMTSSRKAWARLAQRFSGRFRIAAYDQRGHGDAAGVRGPMRLTQQVDDLDAVLAALGEPVLGIIGHSWGGAIAIVGGRDADVQRVVAIDPVLRVTPGTWRADYLDDAEALFALPPAARALSVRSALAGWAPIDIEGKLHAIARMTAEPIAKLGEENRVENGGWNILASVDRYPRQLLILAAGPDDSVMSEADIAHVKASGGRSVRLSMYLNEGHNLHRTAFDAFATEVAAFLGA